MFEATKLQNEIVYGLDDKLIIGVELRIDLRPSSHSITFHSSWKQKWDDSGIFNNIVFISKPFKKTIAVLAQVLVDSRQELVGILLPTSDSLAFDKKIADIKNQIEAKIEAYSDNIESKLD